MEALNATRLTERLTWEDKEYWVHIKAESLLEKYPAKQHARRVQEKLGIDEGLIYLMGQPARHYSDSDMPATFRQLRYFYYLSGDVLSLFIQRIDPESVLWYGRGSNPAEALDRYDIDEVYYVDELPSIVQRWAANRKNQCADIYVLHQSSEIPGYSKPSPRVNSDMLRLAMDTARVVKDGHEINLIRRANDISSQAHREILANIVKFKNEAQVEGLFLDVCISQQAKQQAYDPIAASGPNAGTLHYDANNEDFEDRQLMCLDAGCEYELYASDITRSFPLSAAWPSKEAENIYKLVQRMQETCIEQLAPGVRYLDLHIRAHQIAIDGLLQLGILHNGTREEIYKAGTSLAFFPHGLGHHIGLEVHDVGSYELMDVRRGKSSCEQTPSLYPQEFHKSVYDAKTCHTPTDPYSSHLEEGMVVTVEPGIYFSVYALQQFYLPSPIHSQYINVEVLQHYLPVGGVRIEDDILITSKGYENLTTAPKGDAMFDIIRGSSSDATDMPHHRPRSSPRKHNEANLPPLHAPGLASAALDLALRPLARAATMPPEFKSHGAVDFERFDGPSLFSNLRRSTTTGEKIQQWQRGRNKAAIESSANKTHLTLLPVCGQMASHVQHMYVGDTVSLAYLPRNESGSGSAPKCRNCLILVQTLDRLRQKLSLSEKGSRTPYPKPSPEIRIKSAISSKLTGGKPPLRQSGDPGGSNPALPPFRSEFVTTKAPASAEQDSLQNLLSKLECDALSNSKSNTAGLPSRQHDTTQHLSSSGATRDLDTCPLDSPITANVERLRKGVAKIQTMADQERLLFHRPSPMIRSQQHPPSVHIEQSQVPHTLWQQSVYQTQDVFSSRSRSSLVDEAITEGRRLERVEHQSRLEQRALTKMSKDVFETP